MTPEDWNVREIERGNLAANELAWLNDFGVTLFQLACGLERDGYAGPATRRNSRRLIAEGWQPEVVIDLSHHNADVSLSAMCAAGNVRGVVLKATEGATYTDRRFVERCRWLCHNGVPVTAYHFLRDTSDPVAQADHFVDTWQRALWISGGPAVTLTPVLDVESDGFKKATPGDEIMKLAHAFSDRFRERTGRDPVFYSYPSFWAYRLKGADLSRWWLWMARYNRCLYEGANERKPGRLLEARHKDRVIAWQWRGFNGLWPGIKGAVDINLLAPYGLERWRESGGAGVAV